MLNNNVTLPTDSHEIQDAVFLNNSLISTNWTDDVPGCSIWKEPNHALFQVANAVLLLGLMSPECWRHGVLFLHSTFVIGEWCLFYTGLQIKSVYWKPFSLFLIQNICCGYSKEPSQGDGSFEHQKHMF